MRTLAHGVKVDRSHATSQKRRVMGNKAAHEVEPHNVQQLGFAFDVIDNLRVVGLLPHHAQARFS
jgi:hypothetical protein